MASKDKIDYRGVIFFWFNDQKIIRRTLLSIMLDLEIQNVRHS